ncbi:MAG: cation-transporting P-type ATPase, partial [Nitrospirae bacterium]|nr:cation-transporting P-type ATPase [Nitrospirota bacterium]
NGESLPVSKSIATIRDKDNPLAERYNMVYTGTVVTGGYGKAVVTATGEYTELGTIQRFIDNTVGRETPLERELDVVGRRIVLVCMGVCGLVFGVGLLRGQPIIQMLRSALSLAVAAVPEGLPAVATTTLAFGITTMRSHKVLIRRLKAIELLGDCSIVCFDKTGTITSNVMTVLSIYSGGITTELSGGAFITGTGQAVLYDELKQLLYVCVLCSEVEIREDDSKLILNGSATEKALVDTAINAGCDVQTLRADWPKEKMKYRSEKHNYMVGFHSHSDAASGLTGFERGSGYLVTIKGSPAEVLALCDFIAQNGSIRNMEDSDRKAAIKENGRMADKALRVLGVAYGYTHSNSVMPEKVIWLGLIGMMDPVKDGVKELLRKFHIAGIRTVMITGDQNKTAKAVAEQIGIAGIGELGILDSSSLASLSDDELKDAIGDVAVFSRVSPVHKYRIVRLLQEDGSIVAMTGDGINDGPALKAADIGIAMGQSGTELAREVADVVLETDDLYAMYEAVKHSRTTYLNVRKSLRFLLSTNFSEIMVSFAALTAGLGHPLNIMQLLWINLITDVFPALALALEPPEPDTMKQPPRDRNSQLVGNKDLMKMLRESSVISAGGLAAYGYGLAKYGAGANAGTMSFMGLGLAQLLHSLSCRSERPVIFNNDERPTNKYLNAAVGGSILMQLLCPFIPGLRGLLGLSPITLMDGLVIGASAVAPLIINEGLKNTDNKSIIKASTPILAINSI